jgi:metal-responsive CopG/Arc/MetJ family transcriptional regulator
MNSMPTDKPQILLTIGRGLLKRIEDFRYGHRIPTRSEAIRRLIEEGLKSYEKNSQSKP